MSQAVSYRYPFLRYAALAGSLLVMELARQTAYVHAWVVQDLSSVGVQGLPSNLFDMPSKDAFFGTLWLAVLVACFLSISDLVRNVSGTTWVAIIQAASLVWAATFGFAWLSFLLLGLVNVDLAAAALAGCWVESLIAAAVALRWPSKSTV